MENNQSQSKPDDVEQPSPEGLSSSALLSLVELVGGPRCGDQVRWPENQKVAAVRYTSGEYQGSARYELEGNGKALYVGG